jgi:hypothetical protein
MSVIYLIQSPGYKTLRFFGRTNPEFSPEGVYHYLVGFGLK